MRLPSCSPTTTATERADALLAHFLTDNPYAPMLYVEGGIVVGEPEPSPDAAAAALVAWCAQHPAAAVEAWIVQNFPHAAVISGFRRERDGTFTNLLPRRAA
jgi:hypothetical protein